MVGQYGLKCCQPNGGGLTFLIAYDCLVFVLFFLDPRRSSLYNNHFSVGSFSHVGRAQVGFGLGDVARKRSHVNVRQESVWIFYCVHNGC
jgi:hypothetical protein